MYYRCIFQNPVQKSFDKNLQYLSFIKVECSLIEKYIIRVYDQKIIITYM